MNVLFFCYPIITSHAQELADSVSTVNSPANPFGGAYESPPQIVMIHSNIQYSGVLDSYSFRVAEILGEIPIFNDMVISIIPNQTITVENGSILRFVIKVMLH